MPWDDIERCEVRRGEDGTPLLAAWLRSSGDSPIWLGAMPNDEQAMDEALQKVDFWISRR